MMNQYYIRQHDEQGREHYRAGRGTAHSFGAAAGPHAMKAGDGSNDKAKNSGLKSGGKNVAERSSFKAAR
jgi:hypothetical protein